MSLSSCCLDVKFTPSTPAQGKVQKLAGVDTYVTGDTKSKSAILFVADVFGISLHNSRLLADKYAKGLNAAVYIPDYFDGNDLVKQGILEGKSVDIPGFLGKYPPREPAWKQSEKFVAEIKKQQPGAKVGAVGFCWGATSCLHLGSKNAGDSIVDAIAFCHPSLVETSDFEPLTKPGLFVCLEHDTMFPAEKRNAAWEIACSKLAKNKVFTSFSFVPGQTHGYTTKGDENDEFVAIGQYHAASQVIAHFSLFLS